MKELTVNEGAMEGSMDLTLRFYGFPRRRSHSTVL